jgi:hypothetical protein
MVTPTYRETSTTNRTRISSQTRAISSFDILFAERSFVRYYRVSYQAVGLPRFTVRDLLYTVPPKTKWLSPFSPTTDMALGEEY